MIAKPSLKPFLTAVATEDGWMLHGGESELIRVAGDESHTSVFQAVLPLLDGTRTPAEIERRCADAGLPVGHVQSILSVLEEHGVLDEGGGGEARRDGADPFASQRTYFSRFSGTESGAELQSKLTEATVEVLVQGQLGRSIVEELRRAGFGRIRALGEMDALGHWTGNGSPGMKGGVRGQVEAAPFSRAELAGPHLQGDLLIVALERWDPALLDEVNTAALRSERPWLLVQAPALHEGTVGPLFVPDATACYACLEARLRSHMAFHAEFTDFLGHLRETGDASRPWGGLSAHGGILAGMAVTEAIKFVTGYADSAILGGFVSVDWFTLKTRHHHVLRVPRCMACRPPRVQFFAWSEAPVEPIEEEV